MNDVVFISDLHLHPEESAIHQRFIDFISWAKSSTKQVYILGDFFHAWPGDDGLNEWSMDIAKQIKSLVDAGITVYFMSGNRDFLLGKSFAKESGWIVISEPHQIQLGDMTVLLVHGDRYCTKDKKHQIFRMLTRNSLFIALFQLLPLSYRQSLVDSVRNYSLNSPRMTLEQMDVVPQSVLQHLKSQKLAYLIHGHTHKPGVTEYPGDNGVIYRRYVLSDWDDTPSILCYDKTNGLHYIHV